VGEGFDVADSGNPSPSPAHPPGDQGAVPPEPFGGYSDVATPPQPEEQEALYLRRRNSAGVAAALCGVVALALSWIPFVDYTSLVLGTLAIAFGILGIRRANADPGAGKAMATIGLVCGIAGFAIAAIVLLLIYALVTTINATTA